MLEKNYLDEKALKQLPTRQGFGEALVELGGENPNVMAIGLDITDSVKTGMFRDKFPDRFIECGIAEQNGMGIAAGLSLAGKVPFISTYGVFCPGRNWDQIRISVCYNKANVKFSGAHGGISVGPDGATHQALEDIAITRCLPNLTVLAPCDAIEAKKLTLAAGRMEGPVYMRFNRENTPVFTTEETPFEIGRAQVFLEGKDVTIVGFGPIVHEALLAAEELRKEGIEAEVINSPSIKPLDEKTIVESVKKNGAVVSVEEHQVFGGLGSAVAELLSKNFPAPMEFVGMPDSFGESGQPAELLKKYGMDRSAIKEAVKKVVKRK